MRYRPITEYTEILALEPNEIQDTIAQNMELIIDGIIGASTGVVKGLDCSITSTTGRTINITTGAICDGLGKFYELLSGTTLALPSGTATYTIYTQQSQLNDSVISGWTLIDINTGIEQYKTHSTRLYDGITLNYYNNTTGTVVTNRQDLWEVNVASGTIQTITDIRQYITIGNILANSLQSFYINSNNTAFESNQITGTILKTEAGKKTFLDVKLDTFFTGATAIKINNGLNPVTTGIIHTIEDNMGYKLINNSGSGFVISGNNDNDKAIIINNTSRNIILELPNASSGIIINGSNNSDKAIIINNVEEAINIKSKKAIQISSLYTSGSALSKTILHGNGIGSHIVLSGNTSFNASGLVIETDYEFGKGIVLRKTGSTNKFEEAISISDSSKAIVINNIAGTSGIIINGSNDNDYGLILKDVANGYSSISRNASYTANVMGDISDSIYVNTGLKAIVDEQGIGTRVNFNSNVVNGIGLYVGSEANGLAITGMVISGNVASGINRGLALVNCATGIIIDNSTMGNTVGLKMVNSNIKMVDSASPVNIEISNTLEIFPYSFTMSHDNARLEVESTSSQHVASFVQYGTSKPCLRLSSENYTMIFQGFPNVADKGTFPSYSALSTDRSNINAREACIQAVYDVALDRYRLCFFDGYSYKIIPFLSSISDAGSNGNIVVTGDSGSSNFTLNY